MEEPSIAPASQRLRDRHVVVTGAASGIGRAIAELFHREGAKLALIDRDAGGVSSVARALHAVSLPFDLSKGHVTAQLAGEIGRWSESDATNALGAPTNPRPPAKPRPP